MEPAKMPEQFIVQPPRRIADLAVGESGYASGVWLQVAPDRSVYVYGVGELTERHPGLTVLVSRREDGFHVKLDGYSDKWKPKRLFQTVMDNYIPAASVEE
jgi:hypothetical protein